MYQPQLNTRGVLAVQGRTRIQALVNSTEDLISATDGRMSVVSRLDDLNGDDDDDDSNQQTAKRLAEECDSLAGDRKRILVNMQQLDLAVNEEDEEEGDDIDIDADADENVRQRAGELLEWLLNNEPRGLEVLQSLDVGLPQTLNNAIERSVAAAAQPSPPTPPNNDKLREVEGELERQREINALLGRRCAARKKKNAALLTQNNASANRVAKLEDDLSRSRRETKKLLQKVKAKLDEAEKKLEKRKKEVEEEKADKDHVVEKYKALVKDSDKLRGELADRNDLSRRLCELDDTVGEYTADNIRLAVERDAAYRDRDRARDEARATSAKVKLETQRLVTLQVAYDDNAAALRALQSVHDGNVAALRGETDRAGFLYTQVASLSAQVAGHEEALRRHAVDHTELVRQRDHDVAQTRRQRAVMTDCLRGMSLMLASPQPAIWDTIASQILAEPVWLLPGAPAPPIPQMLPPWSSSLRLDTSDPPRSDLSLAVDVAALSDDCVWANARDTAFGSVVALRAALSQPGSLCLEGVVHMLMEAIPRVMYRDSAHPLLRLALYHVARVLAERWAVPASASWLARLDAHIMASDAAQLVSVASGVCPEGCLARPGLVISRVVGDGVLIFHNVGSTRWVSRNRISITPLLVTLTLGELTIPVQEDGIRYFIVNKL